MMKQKSVKSYEFSTEEERLLGIVINAENHYNLKEGDLWILGKTPTVYYHPNNVCAYDVHTQEFRGRYSIEQFEILGVFESTEDLLQSLNDFHIVTPADVATAAATVENKDANRNNDVYEQLALFD
ncbi:hypothetical protein [Viridibacillus arvi]|uniref:hypothetical protein n=1 Tax=Viridibacillus arvi TaxID=263475 RepID=UPI0034CE5629